MATNWTRANLATDFEDTISAISTPPGEGGVGIVRLSGERAIEYAATVFASSSGRDIRTARGRVFHGHVLDVAGNRVDEVLVHLMRAPHSYTREDVVEINGHGGPGPLRAILEETLRAGARLARPGEFTQRAFLNGRIDLVQAEAVIDQIRARTRAGLLAANAAAGGVLSRKLGELREALRPALARLEAAVDFPEDDLGELVDAALLANIRSVHRQMLELLKTADAGRLYREGAVFAIVGRPNVGKSSLFNALLRDTRAIVSAQPGTTRDRLEECVNIAGVPVKLVDTAGLRATEDEVEQIGVRLAREALQTANLVLFVLDSTAPDEAEDRALAEELQKLESPVIVLLNKSDLAPQVPVPKSARTFAEAHPVSALTGAGMQELEEALGRLLLGGINLSADQAMLTRVHQKDSLRRAVEALERLLQDTTLSPEFLALELQLALRAIGEITGETTPDDILEMVFSSFCIGK
ncbi:MAG: tRNA uridine-5-carboxymethylaminomethyl(34) synthesis GTPase MnmE [Candidatus Hydrogenedentes bacterium]|nr:tRNA uridine-5-carboxymethylaminomethyl(34) synthesis GTPase MnmE [Candidatus Hydrogenedentota bacterium]